MPRKFKHTSDSADLKNSGGTTTTLLACWPQPHQVSSNIKTNQGDGQPSVAGAGHVPPRHRDPASAEGWLWEAICLIFDALIPISLAGAGRASAESGAEGRLWEAICLIFDALIPISLAGAGSSSLFVRWTGCRQPSSLTQGR